MIKTVLMKSWKLLRDSNKNISFFGPPPSIGGLVGHLVGQLVVWLVCLSYILKRTSSPMHLSKHLLKYYFYVNQFSITICTIEQNS